MPLSPELLYLISFSLIILMKIVCFILSYKIVKLGYNLVASGVKGEFKFSSNFIGFKADLASLSPGLLFVLLGVLFMMVAIYVNKTVSYEKGGATPQVTANPGVIPADSLKIPGKKDFPNLFHKP